MKIVVIGAGAAGLLAAGKAAETADEVVIIEKNDIIGKKLLITGKGRCNHARTGNGHSSEHLPCILPHNWVLYASILSWHRFADTRK